MKYKRFNFGTLYVEGTPQTEGKGTVNAHDIPMYPGISYTDGSLTEVSLGNSIAGHEISWLQPEGSHLLIADRVLLCNISWANLNALGLIKGKELLIDGQCFLCRVASAAEWDNIVKTLGNANRVLNWRNMLSWTNDNAFEKNNTLMATLFGFYGATGKRDYEITVRTPNVGYRPILEPLAPLTFNERTITMLDIPCYIQQIPGSDGSFSPILFPVKQMGQNGEFLFDNLGFCGVEDGTSVSMYTLLLNGNPVRQGKRAPQCRKGDKFSITDVFYGEDYLIQWEIFRSAAYCKSELLYGTSAEILKRNGFLR